MIRNLGQIERAQQAAGAAQIVALVREYAGTLSGRL
jgi:hypothetical protein